jgi:hypothetical protein
MMIREVLINEPADVLVRVSTSSVVTPTSFLWRNKTRYVSDVGRQWEERVAGKALRCYLIKTVEENTYELRWDPAANEWTVHRAWLRDLVV